MSSPVSSTKSKAEVFHAEALIVYKFLTDMNYTPPNINPVIEELEVFMVKVMDSRNIRCDYLERTLHMAASIVVLCYPQISMQEKKIASLFTWFFLYADDQVSKDPTPLHHFEQRFARGLPQLDPVMDALADDLYQVWEHWDALTANLIIGSALKFMTCICIEVSVGKLATPVPIDSRFPWFLREGTGVGKAYGCFGFSKSNNFSAMDYAHAIPDMEYWIDLTNDLLSFYKEEMIGDRSNYVHVRAQNDGKSAHEVLSEIAKEMVTTRDIIHASLAQNEKALQTWKAAENGYIYWHLITQERYHLEDLGVLASFSKQSK